MEHDMDITIFWTVFLLAVFASLICGIRAYREYRKGWKADPDQTAKQKTIWQFVGGYYLLPLCVPSVVLGIIVSNILYRSGPSWCQVSVNVSGAKGFLSIAAFIASVGFLIFGLGHLRSNSRKGFTLLLLCVALFLIVVICGR